MTEQEWLAAHPSLMLYHIKQSAPASIRKLRLLAVAYARYLESQADYADAKHVSHLGDEVLDGRKTLDDLWDERVMGWGKMGDWRIANLVLAWDEDLDQTVRKAIAHSLDLCGQETDLGWCDRAEVARSLIRCVLGNLYRQVTVEPSWLTSTVIALARGIYDEKAFDRMPILADALQDAGCENPEILNHCRAEGPHVRGCFVVDLILGKS